MGRDWAGEELHVAWATGMDMRESALRRQTGSTSRSRSRGKPQIILDHFRITWMTE